MRVRAALAFGLLVAVATQAAAQLSGHGGPVRTVAVTPDGRLAVSGSLDSSAIVWALDQERALAVLRVHDGSVNAVAALPDGRFATAGDDGRIALWRIGRAEPETVLSGHEGPVASLAVAPDGAALASASWDGTARVWPLQGGDPLVLRGHAGNVNGVAWRTDGSLVTAGYDATLRAWSREGKALWSQTLPTPLNALARGGATLAAGGADGIVRIVSADGKVRVESEPLGTPVVALAVTPDGARVAAAGIRGTVLILDGATAARRTTLVGPGLPVWSLAFRGEGARLVTGGGDRLLREWDVATGEPVGTFTAKVPAQTGLDPDDRGAQVFRACAVCHSLEPDGGNRAGPTLHGVFGRRIASVPGYPYSPALKGMDIVWNAETIGKLFELGPQTYTPGTKMPEQTVGNADDRAALVRFLEKATR